MTCACGQSGKMRRGMCGTCYMRWLREQPQSLRLSAEDRFWPKVTKDGPIPGHRPELGPCWVWTGRTGTPKGYGQFTPRGRRHVYVHRWSWEQVNGPIQGDLTIDHLCRNRRCVNPLHMELVTRGENTRRGQTPEPCPHCALMITPANMPSHVRAHATAPQRTHVYGVCPECGRTVGGALIETGTILLRRHLRKPKADWCGDGMRRKVVAPRILLGGTGEK